MRREPPRHAHLDMSGRTPAHQLGMIEISGVDYRLIPLGAWTSGTSYVPGNVVTSSGLTYVCILENDRIPGTPETYDDHAPPDATYWQLFDAARYFLDARRIWTRPSAQEGGWLSAFDLPVLKPPQGSGFTPTIDATLYKYFKLVHAGAFSADGNHTIYGLFPLGPRGWYPLMAVAFGAGYGYIDGYFAGAYNLHDSNFLPPALGSGDWIQFSHLDLGHNSVGVPLVGTTLIDVPFDPGLAIYDSLPGVFAIDEAAEPYTQATTIQTGGPDIGTIDGGPGYYAVRFDFDGDVEINDLSLVAHNWF